jgi:threonine synthase
MVNYDLPTIKNKIDRDQLMRRAKGMWRWFELLPVLEKKNIITLGEGDTPLLHLEHLGQEFGLPKLFLKEEGVNPTGSFKARGLSSAVSKAMELGIRKVVIPSAGNAGGALAAYSARAKMPALIYMPTGTPRPNIMESKITGAQVELVEGLIDTAGAYVEEIAASEGWFNMSTFKEPYRVEGKKIIGYEIAESFGWRLPDVIIYPTGGGTGLVGMWKSFMELKALGWLEADTMPRLIAVQAEGCAPVVKAISTGASTCTLWESAHTLANGLCVPKSFADQLILKNIRESYGSAVSVSDQEIIHWQKRLAQDEGIFSCPEGAATVAGLEYLIAQKLIYPDERVVIFNTGSGIKYINP